MLRSFDVVVDADRPQKALLSSFVDPDPRLRREVMGTPAAAVVFQGAARAVVGQDATLESRSPSSVEGVDEIRAKGARSPVHRIGTNWFTHIPVSLKAADDSVGIAGVQRVQKVGNDVARVCISRIQDGWPKPADPVHGPLAAVGAKHN
jgi:hypothetical protein